MLWIPELSVTTQSPPPPHHTCDHRQWDLFYTEIWQVLRAECPLLCTEGASLSNAVPTERHHSSAANLRYLPLTTGACHWVKDWNKGGRKRRGLTFRLFLVGCDGSYEVLGSHVDLRIAVLAYNLQGGEVAENLVGSGVSSYPVLILHHLKIKVHIKRNQHSGSHVWGQPKWKLRGNKKKKSHTLWPYDGTTRLPAPSLQSSDWQLTGWYFMCH